MEKRIVECVPNISEGRDRKVIDAIVGAAADVTGITVLDVDPGADTNRTVITFIGSPSAVEEAAFRLIARSADLIDMAQHSGAHPRQGATDVCPFVPVAGVTMADCVDLARRVGRRVGEALKVPVYLYAEAAQRPERRALADVRHGEYESLSTRLRDPEWRPDFGPAEFKPRFGAVAIGAREFLIAYNVNLNTRAKQPASEIAAALRETGRAVRSGQTGRLYASGQILKYQPSRRIFPCGDCLEILTSMEALDEHVRSRHSKSLRDELAFFGLDPEKLEGQSVMMRGRFRECRAVGWHIPQYDRAQVSINLTNFRVTPMHAVLEDSRRLAADLGVLVTGSELVGIAPYEAIRESGRYYLERQGTSRGLPVADVVETAIQSLGLRDLGPFDPTRSILGLPAPGGPLVTMRVHELADEVSRPSPTPGGGSVAALAGALAAGLGAMVANLTHGKSDDPARRAQLEEQALSAQEIKDDLLRAVDADSAAFNEVLAAMRLPRGTPVESTARDRAIEEGYKGATRTPLKTAERCLEALRLLKTIAAESLKASVTDAGVGGLLAHAAFTGAIYNVRINLKSIADRRWCAEMEERLDVLATKASGLAAEVAAIVERELVAPASSAR